MSQKIEAAMAQVPPAARKTVAALDGLSIFVGKSVAWFAVPMMFSLIYEVTMRYFFQKPTIWAMDITLMLYGAHFMLGSAYCLQAGQHIRTDFFYHNWSVRTKAAVDLAMYIILFFPVHLVFLDVGWAYFWKSFSQNETSVISPWMPPIWPVKLAIPLCVFLTLTQGISEVVKCRYRFKTGVNLWPISEIAEAAD